jgi:hypothetical protein
VPDDAAWAEHLVVPDDIHELQAEIDDYYRELRSARRLRRWGWLLSSSLWRRWSFPLGVVTGIVALAAVLFALLAVESSPSRSLLGRAPLAAPSVAPGLVRGLLPDVSLAASASGTGRVVAARDLRPGVVVLVPLRCNCSALLDSMAGQAAKARTRLFVVAPAGTDAEVAALPGQIRHGFVVPLFDTTGQLARAYGARGVTALIVEPDGVVYVKDADMSQPGNGQLPLEGFPVTPVSFRSG